MQTQWLNQLIEVQQLEVKPVLPINEASQQYFDFKRNLLRA